MSRYRRRSGRLTPDPLRRFLLQFAQRKWQAVGMSELSPHLAAQLKALTVVAASDPKVVVEIPVRLDSRGNSSQHHFERAEKVKVQRGAARGVLAKFRDEFQREDQRWVVVVTRVAPRQLDPHDNLGSSLKATIDGVADAFGVNDRNPRVTFLCDQRAGEPKEYAARIAIYAVTP